MKTLAYILLISFAWTISDPFISEAQCCEEISDIHTEKSCCAHDEDSEESDTKKEKENMDHKCSLFCQCDCCGHITVFNVEFFKLSPQEHHTVYKPVISESYHFDLINAIWQPPRQLLS